MHGVSVVEVDTVAKGVASGTREVVKVDPTGLSSSSETVFPLRGDIGRP